VSLKGLWENLAAAARGGWVRKGEAAPLDLAAVRPSADYNYGWPAEGSGVETDQRRINSWVLPFQHDVLFSCA